MQIIKKSYSKSPWRLVDSEGNEVYAQQKFEHPSLGWTVMNGPICGDTKAECLAASLELLERLMKSLFAAAA